MMLKSLWSLLVLFLVILDYTEGWRRRRRRRCPVTNCAVSAWTKYSPCSQSCGNGGTKKRTRTVTRPATCGGGCPYALVDIQPCNRGCPNGGTPVTGRCICKSGYSGRCCTGGIVYVYDLFISFSFPLLISKLILPMNASRREKMDTLRSLVVLNITHCIITCNTNRPCVATLAIVTLMHNSA